MYRVFTRDEAMAAGISPAQLRSPRYRSISRGLYCPTSVLPSQAEVVAALMRKLPVAQFACRETAAGLHGAVVPHSSAVHLGTAQRRTSTRPDVALHWYRSHPELTRVRGLTVTSPRQTFLDLAATLPFVDLLVLGDSLVHAEACTVDSDIARREELDDDWKFIVLTSRDIHRKQAQTAERVHKALRARGYKGPFDPLGWRRHFAP